MNKLINAITRSHWIKSIYGRGATKLCLFVSITHQLVPPSCICPNTFKLHQSWAVLDYRIQQWICKCEWFSLDVNTVLSIMTIAVCVVSLLIQFSCSAHEAGLIEALQGNRSWNRSALFSKQTNRNTCSRAKGSNQVHI